MPTPSINLFKESNTLSPRLAKTAQQLKTFGIYGLGIILCVGLLVGITYTVLTIQINALSKEKERLSASLGSQIKKEGLYASLQDRLTVVKKVRSSQHPVAPIFDIVTSVATEPVLTGFTTKSGTVEFTIEVPTIEDALSKVSVLLMYEQQKKISSSKLTNINVNDDGTVSIAFSFIPIF